MSKHHNIDPLAVPVEQIHSIIAKASALLAKPSTGGVEWLDFLRAVDVVEGCDALADTISDMEDHLGISESECLCCGQDRCGCDQSFDDFRLAPIQRVSPTSLWA